MYEGGRKLCESFAIGVGMRQGGVMSPWLFNTFIDDCTRKIKAEEENVGS